jgi:methionyl-tRNA formyltransferase
MSYVLADSRSWRPQMAENLATRTGAHFYRMNSPDELTAENLTKLGIQRVFLPHWSYRIPDAVYSHFDCIVFHMTDVPYGRGGSPLQNLIARGIYETKISALKCTASLDAGPVYMKCALSLHGSAEEIYIRASAVIEDMIVHIITHSPEPVEQQGEVVVFRRRTPEEGNITELSDLRQIYDYIRMLDAEGYPKAFLDVGPFRLEFRRASLTQDGILADVVIRRKE